MKSGTATPNFSDWASMHLPGKSVIGFDPWIVSASGVKKHTLTLERAGHAFTPIVNIVNEVWTAREPLSNNPIYEHGSEFYSESSLDKLKNIKDKAKTDVVLISSLDEIAWALNLRGSDFPHVPLFFAYLVLDFAGESTLFVNPQQAAHVQGYLRAHNIKVLPYDKVLDYLQAEHRPVFVDEGGLNYKAYKAVAKPVGGQSPITQLKAVKTARQIRGFRESHLRDAVCVCTYIATLKRMLEKGQQVDEYQGASLLAQLRSQQPLNKGQSFSTISAVGPNGAIIHYRPDPLSSLRITKDSMYLLDSGGQYLDGTVDTTRTMHFGKPSAWEKETYTRVLLGNIELERVVWPADARISGADLDVLARKKLWERGLVYSHGTGHGVGYFLNVHEGPHGISSARRTVLVPGMVVTNEPGYYEESKFGIRIENMMCVQASQDLRGFLRFENFTKVPYDRNLIDKALMDKKDVEFVDEYHRKVWDALGGVLRARGDEETLEWLKDATAPL